MNAIEAMRALLEGKRIRASGSTGPYFEVVDDVLQGEFGGTGSVVGGVEYEEVDLMEEVERLRGKGKLLLEELDRINLKIQALEERMK